MYQVPSMHQGYQELKCPDCNTVAGWNYIHLQDIYVCKNCYGAISGLLMTEVNNYFGGLGLNSFLADKSVESDGSYYVYRTVDKTGFVCNVNKCYYCPKYFNTTFPSKYWASLSELPLESDEMFIPNTRVVLFQKASILLKHGQR